jgi:hypothetical protein
MKLAEFRVYVQVDNSSQDTVLRMRDFIRTCIENLDGVNAVEVEPSRGLVPEPYQESLSIEKLKY